MDKPLCRLCRRRRLLDADSHRSGFCKRCRDDYAAAPLTPAQRPPGPCRRCQFPQIVRVRLRHLVGEYRTMAPLAAGYPLVAGRLHTAPDTDQPLGLLEAYVCRACGYAELFAVDPGAIPIGPEHGTELIEATEIR